MNNRIVEWKVGASNGQVVAGGNGIGTKWDRLSGPGSVLIDKEMDRLIICDGVNRPVVKWSLRRDTKEGELLIDNISMSLISMKL